MPKAFIEVSAYIYHFLKLLWKLLLLSLDLALVITGCFTASYILFSVPPTTSQTPEHQGSYFILFSIHIQTQKLNPCLVDKLLLSFVYILISWLRSYIYVAHISKYKFWRQKWNFSKRRTHSAKVQVCFLVDCVTAQFR